MAMDNQVGCSCMTNQITEIKQQACSLKYEIDKLMECHSFIHII